MSGSFSVRADTTPISAGNPSQTNPRNTRICTCSDDSSHDNGANPKDTSANDVSPGTYQVATIANGYAIRLLQDDGTWLTVGTYAARAVADEIVQIANGNPDTTSLDGETPDSAMPFSHFGLDDMDALTALVEEARPWA